MFTGHAGESPLPPAFGTADPCGKLTPLGANDNIAC